MGQANTLSFSWETTPIMELDDAFFDGGLFAVPIEPPWIEGDRNQAHRRASNPVVADSGLIRMQ
ncbi:hypothetical protein AWB74_08597 [Caballeronia arvi]|uniref:Uncharacterized protein n=1 Tax=Caballeronia arvi TaxID=1777135 RepID=A0A158L6K5_9BURK|nr:hypothetical protein AWB74_08597 [Caballeronia arvi]